MVELTCLSCWQHAWRRETAHDHGLRQAGSAPTACSSRLTTKCNAHREKTAGVSKAKEGQQSDGKRLVQSKAH
jgi:hypothetical protein